MQAFFVIVSLALGTVLIISAGLGVVRFPDLYMRMSASTKAVTLGVGFLLVAAAIHFYEFGYTSKSLAIILFLLLTAPVSAHRIGRAAYKQGVPLWEKSIQDELAGRYDSESNTLHSSPPRR